MNIDNTELLEALKRTEPPKPEMAAESADESASRDWAHCVGKEG